MTAGRVHVVYHQRGEVVEYELRPSETSRGWQAMMLAPTLEICQALLRGEPVPLSALRPEWVKRFGLSS